MRNSCTRLMAARSLLRSIHAVCRMERHNLQSNSERIGASSLTNWLILNSNREKRAGKVTLRLARALWSGGSLSATMKLSTYKGCKSQILGSTMPTVTSRASLVVGNCGNLQSRQPVDQFSRLNRELNKRRQSISLEINLAKRKHPCKELVHSN